MTGNKMYSKRKGNIAVMRSCFYSCIYCAFQKFQKISACPKCRDNIKHSHMEVLQRTPPKTKDGEFLTVGLSGDISFMSMENFKQVIEYCRKWKDRTFLIQSKDPEYFLPYRSGISQVAIPNNVILGTTIETINTGFFRNPKLGDIKDNFMTYSEISKAPNPEQRYEAMLELNCRKAVTIEPIIKGDLKTLARWIIEINPEFCWVGYNSNFKLHLPEPSLAETQELIIKLRDAGIEVREKLLRPAWWELPMIQSREKNDQQVSERINIQREEEGYVELQKS